MTTANLFFSFNRNGVKDNMTVNERFTFVDLVSYLESAHNKPSFYDEMQGAGIYAANNTDGGVGSVSAAIKSAIDKQKQMLPCFNVGGYNKKSHGVSKDFEYNGCVQLDFDFKCKNGDEIARNLKDMLRNIDSVAMAAISPSGVGVKGILLTDNTDHTIHAQVARQVEAMLIDIIGSTAKFDDGGSTKAGQACYAMFDDDMYVNYDAVQFKADYNTIMTELKSKEDAKKVVTTFTPSEFTGSDKQLEKKLNIALRKALEKDAGGKCGTVVSFAGIITRFGISPDAGWEFLTRSSIAHNMYGDRRSQYYGSVKTVTSHGDFGIWNDDTRTNLPKDTGLVIDKYLTEIADKLTIVGNTLIVAPTGSGKTTWVKSLSSMKRILVVPTTPMVRQVAADAGAVMFYGKTKDAQPTDMFIVTTYASLTNLANKLGESFKEFTLFLDEFHKFTSDSSTTYQYNQLRAALDVTRNLPWIALTATPLHNYSSLLQPKTTHVVKRRTNPIKNITTITTDVDTKNEEVVVEKVTESKKAGRKALIFVNNTKDTGAYGIITAGLQARGITFASINSTQADTEDFADVTVDGDMSKSDCIIATSILKEGVSITKGFGDIVDIFIVGSWHAMEIEQFSNRTRGAKVINAYRIRNQVLKKDGVETDDDVNMNQVRYAIRARQEKSANAFQTIIDNAVYHRSSIIDMLKLPMNASACRYNMIDNTVTVDELLLSNLAYDAETRIAETNDTFFKTCMKEYGWNVNDNIAHVNGNDAISKDEKSNIEGKVKEARNMDKVVKENAINIMVEKSLDELKAYLDGVKNGDVQKGDTTHYEAAKKLVTIANQLEYDGDMKKCGYVLSDIGFSNPAMEMFKNSVRMYRSMNEFDGSDEYTRAILSLVQTFGNDLEIVKERESRINAVKESFKFVGMEINDYRAEGIFSQLFIITKKLSGSDGNRKREVSDITLRMDHYLSMFGNDAAKCFWKAKNEPKTTVIDKVTIDAVRSIIAKFKNAVPV